MQVDERLVEESRVALEASEVRRHIAVGDLGGFLHHIPQLAGQFEAALGAVNPRRLDAQGGSTHGGPRQSGDDTGAFQRFFFLERGLSQVTLQIRDPHLHRLVRIVQQLHDALAENLVQQFFQAPHPGLAGIALNDLFDGGVGDVELLFQQAGPLQQPGQQVVFGDSQLFFRDVTGQANHVHPVEQWPRNRIELVGGTDEQNLGQVHAHIEIVVQELAVLLRIQGLQKGGCWITLERRTNLVDFIQHDHRVCHFRIFQRLDKLTGHGADIGAAVALDLSFIPHATNAETVELPPQCIRYGMADRRLADARRAYEQQD